MRASLGQLLLLLLLLCVAAQGMILRQLAPMPHPQAITLRGNTTAARGCCSFSAYVPCGQTFRNSGIPPWSRDAQPDA